MPPKNTPQVQPYRKIEVSVAAIVFFDMDPRKSRRTRQGIEGVSFVSSGQVLIAKDLMEF